METITSESIKKLHRHLADKFIPVAKSLRGEGLSDHEILVEFDRYRNCEIKKFYRNGPGPVDISASIKLITESKPDSKIEGIFYYKIEQEKIKFQFQYKIGIYRVDFLIEGFLVFEIDGPHHKAQKDYGDKRDKYILEMGYQVLRVPSWLVAMEPNAVIDEIKEQITKNKEVKL